MHVVVIIMISAKDCTSALSWRLLIPEQATLASYSSVLGYAIGCVYMCAAPPSACVLTELTSVQTKNWDSLLWAVVHRPEGTPLVTISNNWWCVDDPLVWGKWVWVSVCVNGVCLSCGVWEWLSGMCRDRAWFNCCCVCARACLCVGEDWSFAARCVRVWNK